MKSKNEKICLVVLTAILVISAFSVIPTTVGAQPVEVWNVTWSNSMGSAIATAGDCVYLAGANSADTDAFLNKYDKDGNLLWNITWEIFAPEVAAGFPTTATAARDSVYLAGTTLPSNISNLEAFLNKYDSDGNLIWNITLGRPVGVLGSATAATDDCVYLLAGEIIEPHSDNYTFLNKYDKDGNLIWNITWGGTAGTYLANAVATSGGSVYVAGSAGRKAFLNKYDSDGNLLWNITEGAIAIETIATGDNAVYIAGNTVPGVFLNKYNSTNGNLLWNITRGGIGTLGGATATSGDSVYLAGLNESIDFDFCNTFLNKYNGTDGSLIWNITWGKTGWVTGRAIATTGDGVVYLAGSKTNESVAPAYANESDAFLVKFSEPTPSPTPTPPGFEAGFAIVGLLAVAYLVLRRRK